MKKKLKVLFPFVGDTLGGSHISALALIDKLPEFGIEPVIVVHQEGLLTQYLNDQGIPYLRAPEIHVVGPRSILSQMWTMLRTIKPLVQFLRKQAIDIVHTNDARMHLSWILATWVCGRRFVWHQRNPVTSRRIAYYGRLADAVVTISNYCRFNFPDSFGVRAVVIDNPFEIQIAPSVRIAARKNLLREFGAPEDACIIGFIGNTILRKRPRVFVASAAQLVALYQKPLLFPMIGACRPPEYDAVRRLIAERGLSKICPLLGVRTPVEPLIAGFDILLAPAVNEGFGRVLVEAMLVGTPVVASADGGHREIIRHGETGFLVTPDDPEAMAGAILSLLHQPELRMNIAAHAMAEARGRYSSRRHAQEIVAIYGRLAN